jgi:protein phosphatase
MDEWNEDDWKDTDPELPGPLTPSLNYPPFRPLSSTVTAQVTARSLAGARPVNDDHFLVVELGRHQQTLATNLPDGHVPARFQETGYGMIVADGMGPEAGTASRLAISTLAHLVLHFGRWNLRIDAETASGVIARAQRFYSGVDKQLAEAALNTPRLAGMRAAMTAAFSAGDSLFVAHVGHSRAYQFRGGILRQLTRDQTLRQRVADWGPGLFEAAASELNHILTDAIGGHGDAAVQIGHFELRDQDVVLLCTNGLTDCVDEASIVEILKRRGALEDRCVALGKKAIERGARDNVTLILAEYSIPTVPPVRIGPAV